MARRTPVFREPSLEVGLFRRGELARWIDDEPRERRHLEGGRRAGREEERERENEEA